MSSPNLSRALIGSAPGERTKMRGAVHTLSLKDPFKSNGGGSMYLQNIRKFIGRFSFDSNVNNILITSKIRLFLTIDPKLVEPEPIDHYSVTIWNCKKKCTRGGNTHRQYNWLFADFLGDEWLDRWDHLVRSHASQHQQSLEGCQSLLPLPRVLGIRRVLWNNIQFYIKSKKATRSARIIFDGRVHRLHARLQFEEQ